MKGKKKHKLIKKGNRGDAVGYKMKDGKKYLQPNTERITNDGKLRQKKTDFQGKE